MGFGRPPDVRAAAEEVRKSMEWVTRVGELMQQGVKGEIQGLEMVGMVSDSLAAALELLRVGSGEAAEDEGGESALSHCSRGSEGKFAGRRRGRGAAPPPAAAKKGRGRRRSNSHSCRRTTSATVNDGFTWRKYGQKDIHGSKYPRSYFRCTYKYSRKCQAMKQVQRCEEDSSTFLIVYIGQHTCRHVPASAADDTKPLQETGEASPPPLSPITAAAVPLKDDCEDCKDPEDLWSKLELHVPETAKRSPLSSSSIYGGGDMEMLDPFDVSGFFDFSGSCGE